MCDVQFIGDYVSVSVVILIEDGQCWLLDGKEANVDNVEVVNSTYKR